ncbi:cytochrome P450 [Lojkania enalia]|uniref:Cytochrome P450 n=1 Tax=Lojkania enalia TaxID=147567 RepID=A0A9P4N476_9PLEO|nr:cytochrome P450 [Didymosphaeria enalia]
MGIASHITLAIFFGIVGLYVIRRLVRSKRNGLPLPPGPKGVFLLGNINDMPKSDVLEAFHWLKHKDLYGLISSVTTMGQTIIIINDSELATELLTNRAAIHSSRPRQVLAGEIVGWINSTALTPNNDKWRKLRKIISQVVSSNKSVTMFDKMQEVESAHFLLNLLDSPDNLFDHIRKEAGSVISRITYGYTPEAHDADPLVDLAGQAGHTLQEATVPGKWMVDILSFLRYFPDGFPGTSFKRPGSAMRDTLTQCVEQPYAWVKQQMREKRHKTSFLSQAIESTVSSLQSFFLAMMLFPDVQEKAQEEIDRVIGGDRLPITVDRHNLPYLWAAMKETHRWHPVGPMGIAHASAAEDICNGYRIPKGSILLANTWRFTHDPSVYPDPMTFRPERFIETPTHKPEPDPRNLIFGYGRRVCPGRYVADNAVFITIAQTLAVFNISKPADETGKVIEPKLEFEPGTVSRPVPYKAQIKPRTEKYEALIRKSEDIYPWEPSDAKELGNVRWK